jgi:hypothetical protein
MNTSEKLARAHGVARKLLFLLAHAAFWSLLACSSDQPGDYENEEAAEVASPIINGNAGSPFTGEVTFKYGTLGCSGVMVDNLWFLTAKHCMPGITNPNQLTDMFVDDQGTQYAQASDLVYLHSDPNLDVALVRLTSLQELYGSRTNFVRPIYSGSTSGLIYNFVTCTGYGEYYPGVPSSVLRQAILWVESAGGNIFRVRENVSSQIQGHGDSGGGCYNSSNGTLYGITKAYFNDTVHPWEVDVTSVEFFRGWMTSIIGSKIALFNNGQWWIDRNGSRSWDAADRWVPSFGAGLQGLAVHHGSTDSGYRTALSHIAAFSPSTGSWYIDQNNNETWDGASIDKFFNVFGGSGDIGISGYWPSASTIALNQIGVFRSGSWYLDLNNDGAWNGTPTDGFYSSFGPGLTPVVGAWPGNGANGRTYIGAFSGTTWYLDLNGNGIWDSSIDRLCTWGQAGDKPVVGDWDANGSDNIGTFNAGSWWLDLNGNCSWDGVPTDALITGFGQAGDVPLAGRWR